MLSTLFNSVRKLLPSSISEQHSAENISVNSPVMVTTRRQSGNKYVLDGGLGASTAGLGDRSPLQPLPPAPRKRNHSEAANSVGSNDEGSSLSNMKRTKRPNLSLRNKEGDLDEKDIRFAPETSASTIGLLHALNPVPSSHKSTPEQAFEENPGENRQNHIQGPNIMDVDETRHEQVDLKPGVEKEEDGINFYPSPLEIERSGREEKAIKSKERKKSCPSREQSTDIGQAFLKPVHKHFDQEQDGEEDLNEYEAECIKEVLEGSDDDAEPDEVATRDVEGKIFEAARDAAKAAAKMENLMRQKRRERDAQLKEQAKLTQKKKRAANRGAYSTNNIPGKLLATTTGLCRDISPLPRQDRTEPSSAEETHTLDNDRESSNVLATGPRSRSTIAGQYGDVQTKSKFSKSNIPQFLPSDYLEDTPMLPLEPMSQSERISRSSKKVKLHHAVEKRPKDLAVGSTTYRVSEVGADGMPPRASKIARATKEAWLSSRRIVRGEVRRSASSGFFINGKRRK